MRNKQCDPWLLRLCLCDDGDSGVCAVSQGVREVFMAGRMVEGIGPEGPRSMRGLEGRHVYN